MSEKEFEGKDLEEALNAASSAMNVSADELHYEMIEQGRRGLLGLGTRNVRIRVKPSLEQEIPIDDTEVSLAPPEEREKAEGRGRRKSRGQRGERAEQDGEEKSERPRRRRSRSRRRGGAGRKRGGDGESRARRERPEQQQSDKPMVEDAVAQSVGTTLTQIVELSGLELAVDATPQRGGVAVALEGGDQLKLSENNSELLLAMQFLLNRMARRTWPEAGRIKLSTAGTTEEPRDEQLVALTHEIAEKVRETGKTQKMKPMNAYERRLVHLTVREYAGLSSSSDGRGSMKRVRISKIQNQI